MSKHYHPQRKTYRKHCIPLPELLTMARGRWLEILTAAGIPESALVGRRGRPCPRCGGRDRFSPLRDVADRGAVLCRHCFNGQTEPRPGDGLSTLRWWLGIDFAEACRWLSGWLGVIPGYRSWSVAPAEFVSPVHVPDTVDERLGLMAQVMTGNMRPGWLNKAAELLGVASEALARLRVGWSPVHRAVSWPMHDELGQVIGIRLRCPETARKWAVKGSRAGLFYCVELLTVERPGRVYVAEGPTDTAALLSIGLHAVGVPSAGGGRELLAALVHRIGIDDLVIVADGDGPGLIGAHRLADALAGSVPVRIINPPQGIKDARAWVIGGADASMIETAADRAPVHSAGIGGAS